MHSFEYGQITTFYVLRTRYYYIAGAEGSLEMSDSCLLQRIASNPLAIARRTLSRREQSHLRRQSRPLRSVKDGVQHVIIIPPVKVARTEWIEPPCHSPCHACNRGQVCELEEARDPNAPRKEIGERKGM